VKGCRLHMLWMIIAIGLKTRLTKNVTLTSHKTISRVSKAGNPHNLKVQEGLSLSD